MTVFQSLGHSVSFPILRKTTGNQGLCQVFPVILQVDVTVSEGFGNSAETEKARDGFCFEAAGSPVLSLVCVDGSGACPRDLALPVCMGGLSAWQVCTPEQEAPGCPSPTASQQAGQGGGELSASAPSPCFCRTTALLGPVREQHTEVRSWKLGRLYLLCPLPVQCAQSWAEGKES